MRTKHGVIAALCWLVAGAAWAQDAPAAWTDPLNRFAIDFAPNGFAPMATPSDSALAVEAEHATLQRSAGAPRTCSVREERLPRVYATGQGDANARLYARTEQDLATAARGRIGDFRRERVDGVSVLSFRLDTGATQHLVRLFMLAQNGGVYQVSVMCGGPSPLSLLDVSTMNQTIETLRFLPEAGQ